MNSNCAFLLLVLLALGGCGYQLKSSDPGTYFRTYKFSGDQKILACQSVADRLERAGLASATSGTDKGIVVWCLSEKTDRRAVSVDASSLGAEYQIVYSVKYALESSDGRKFVQPFWVSRSDTFLYDRRNLLGTHNEESAIRDELVERIADQMIRAISRVSIAPEI